MINQKNKRGNTPLHIAVRKGYVAISELLLESGANKDYKNKKGQTVLEIARENGNTHLELALM